MGDLNLRINHKKINEKKVWLYCVTSRDPELTKISKFIKKRGLRAFPYEFIDQYKRDEIQVNWDNDGYPYVNHHGNDLYLKKEWDRGKCQRYYNSLRIEQDPESPHKYLTEKARYLQKSDVVADVGAAEGFFSLDIIDTVEKIYIFEADKAWLIPLQKTFAKWQNKVEIVHKFVSDSNDGDNITLDSFFKNKRITYLKADIEGAEALMISGAIHTFNHSIKKALICTYHRHDDEKKLGKMMIDCGFDISFNKGYILYFNDKESLKYPYLRKGVMFCSKEYRCRNPRND